MHELVTIDTDFIHARFNYETCYEFNCTVMKSMYYIKMPITSVLLTARCCNINCISILD